MILLVSLTRFLHSYNSLRHEGILKKIAPAALVLQILEYTMCPTQTKTCKIACGAFLHTTYNENGLQRLYSQHLYTMCTYQKNVLFVVLDGM